MLLLDGGVDLLMQAVSFLDFMCFWVLDMLYTVWSVFHVSFHIGFHIMLAPHFALDEGFLDGYAFIRDLFCCRRWRPAPG